MHPAFPASRNLHVRVARGAGERPLGWGLGSWGRPLPLTPALPLPAQAPPPDASEQEVLVNNQPPGQVRDKAAHIRGDRGGSAFHPASYGVSGRPPLRLISRWARSSGHQQRRAAVTVFPGALFSALQEVNVLAQPALAIWPNFLPTQQELTALPFWEASFHSPSGALCPLPSGDDVGGGPDGKPNSRAWLWLPCKSHPLPPPRPPGEP